SIFFMRGAPSSRAATVQRGCHRILGRSDLQMRVAPTRPVGHARTRVTRCLAGDQPAQGTGTRAWPAHARFFSWAAFGRPPRMEPRMSPPRSAASPRLYAGLFLVTLATVMYEIVLTRIFSVTMWYHFAFVAISVAMFGMTVGALIVYLRPARFPAERLSRQLGASALLFGLTVVASFLTHVVIPFTVGASLVALWSVMLTYVAIAVPFVFSGICVCLVLTRFPRELARLYATDLVGAAAGCLLVILVIDRTDGPTTVVAIGALAAFGAACFLLPADGQGLRVAALGVVTVLALLVAVNSVLIAQQTPLIGLVWVKGAQEPHPLFEKWNSFSRLTVTGNPDRPIPPLGWGLSPTYPRDRRIPQPTPLIDAPAGPWLPAFPRNLERPQPL